MCRSILIVAGWVYGKLSAYGGDCWLGQSVDFLDLVVESGLQLPDNIQFSS